MNPTIRTPKSDFLDKINPRGIILVEKKDEKKKIFCLKPRY